MYFINPHIPAYYFNRKKQTEPVAENLHTAIPMATK